MGSTPIAQTPTPANMLTTLMQHPLACTWQWEIIIVGNLLQLITDIQSGNGYAVSNGSFQTGKGTAAWIIEGHNGKNHIVGMGLSPSNDKGHSSFCSNFAGIYGILFTLQMILTKMPRRASLRVACDGKLVLSRLRWLCMTDLQEPHVDLMSATRKLLQISAIQVELAHIKGHQDKNIQGPFTRDAMLNIKADQLACNKLTNYITGPQRFHIPWSQGVCYTGAQQVEKTLGTPYMTTSMASP